jgi:hypothetical protein
MSLNPFRYRNLRTELLETRLAMDSGGFESQPVIDISPVQQHLVELINRARRDPLAEAARWGIGLNDGIHASSQISPSPKQPLAIHNALVAASQVHSDDMAARNYFAHTNPDNKSPSDRAIAAGYPNGVGENLALSHVLQNEADKAAIDAHELLFKSPGHRQNILNSFYEDIGVAIAFTEAPGFPAFRKTLTTEKFGNNWTSERFSVTGVAFRDRPNDDAFYSIGEELRGIRVIAIDSNGNRYETTTGSSGTYQLLLPSGDYRLRFAHGVLGTQTVTYLVTLSSENIKTDLDLSTAKFDPPISLPKMDVDLDGFVTPLDVLAIVNHLNQSRTYAVALDIDDDKSISPLDVLIVVNFVNQRSSSRASGEGEATRDSAFASLFWEETELSSDRSRMSKSRFQLGSQRPDASLLMRFINASADFAPSFRT